MSDIAVQARWIGSQEVRSALSPSVARSVIAEVLEELRADRAGAAQRQFHGPSSMPLGVMIGYSAGHVGLKAITVVPDNRARGLPTIQGVVVLFDIGTGSPVAAMDGTALTSIRTAAIAGFATEHLAVADASEMVMAGAGLQAPDQIAAVLDVRRIERVTLWNRTRQHAETLAKELSTRHPDLAVEVADDLQTASVGADVISLATSTREQLLDREGIGSHCHINAMGSFRPDHRELGSDLMADGEVFVDTRDGCLEEAGDVLVPIEEGRLSPDALRPLWDANESSRERLTILKSVGAASFDIACAARVARELELIPPPITASACEGCS